MSTLYELTGIYQQIYELDIDEKAKLDTLDSMDWQEEFDKKVEGYVKVIKSIDGDIDVIDKEIERLKELKDSKKRKNEYLKEKLKNAFEITGIKKVDTGLFVISTWMPKASVFVDEEILPKEYFITKTTITPDKKFLYEELKNGVEIPGAVLQHNIALRIK